MADKPITREEKYLAYLTGDYKGGLPKPITRKEKYLYELCLKGIGGEISPEEIKAAVNEYLEKNPVKPGATTEQARQIEQNKTNIASLKEDLNNILSPNLFNPKDAKENAAINQGDGTEMSFDGWLATGYIPVSKNDVLYFSSNEEPIPYSTGAFYDKNKQRVDSFGNPNNNNNITVTSDGYARFSFNTVPMNLQIEKGSRTTYVPYGELKVKVEVDNVKEDIEISLLENDRLYEGTNLAEKFKDEIANYSDIWQWIKARIKAGNFAGIHVNDFIRWQTTDNEWIESRVAGINTYRRYGDRGVPNHIDFISKDLWPTLHAMNSANYNNGIIPIENLSGDGTKTAFVLTNEMAAVASVTIGGAATTAYTYDVDTHTITFTDAPTAGTNNIIVTGTGSEYPWLASDLYLYVNSLKGHVAGGTSKTSPVKLVDYTNDGIWSKLPEALKTVIVAKRALLPQRYSASGVLSNSNSWGWQDTGKLWLPSEIEVYGHGTWADNPWDKGGFIQYPIFNCNTRRVKGLGDGGGCPLLVADLCWR